MAMYRSGSTMLLCVALVTSALLGPMHIGAAQTDPTDLKSHHPQLARLLEMAAPETGLASAQLDTALGRIAAWALESDSQLVDDQIGLLADKNLLDYSEATSMAIDRIRIDGDLSDWPKWSRLWPPRDADADVLGPSYIRAVHVLCDGDRLMVAITPKDADAFATSGDGYKLHLDSAGDTKMDIVAHLSTRETLSWQEYGADRWTPLEKGTYAYRIGDALEMSFPRNIVAQLHKSNLLGTAYCRHLTGPSQWCNFELPVDPCVSAARALLPHASGESLPPAQSLPTSVLEKVRAVRGTLAAARQVGNILVLEDQGEIIYTIGSEADCQSKPVGETGFNSWLAARTALRALGSTPLSPEPYDYLCILCDHAVYHSPKTSTSRLCCCFPLVETAQGDGGTRPDRRIEYWSHGALKALVLMNGITDFSEKFAPDSTSPVCRRLFCHEFGHPWLAYAKLSEATASSLHKVLLSNSLMHWSRFMSSSGSVMSEWVSPVCHDVRDLGDGKFEMSPHTGPWRFSELDLYLMGLLPPDQVPATFVVLDPTITEKQVKPGCVFEGRRHDLTIDDIIAANGVRRPGSDESQKSYRVAFVLVSRDPDMTSESIVLAEALRRRFTEVWWPEATAGLSEVRSNLEHTSPPTVGLGPTPLYLPSGCDAKLVVALAAPARSQTQALLRGPDGWTASVGFTAGQSVAEVSVPAFPSGKGVITAEVPGYRAGFTRYEVIRSDPITVTSAADAGDGSLRAAITAANGRLAAVRIGFADHLAGSTIELATPLPALKRAGTVIDGDINGDGRPDITIMSKYGDIAQGLDVRTSGVHLNGLALCGFRTTGLRLGTPAAHGNLVTSCHLGVNAARENSALGQRYGIEISDGASGNAIGRPGAGNFIASNTRAGVALIGLGDAADPDNPFSTTGNSISANAIGMAGLAPGGYANGDGVLLADGAIDNTVGGDSSRAGNLIVGNRIAAVRLRGHSTTGNTIASNAFSDMPPGRAFSGGAAGSAGRRAETLRDLIVEEDGASGNTVQDNR